MQNRKRDTDVQNRHLDSVGEGEGGMFWENSIETSILSRVKQITSPGWMHETSAQGWWTGKTQRDGMGREAGGGMGWGTHLNPWLIHVNVWQKPLQYCKVISLQLIKKKKTWEEICLDWKGKAKHKGCLWPIFNACWTELDSSELGCGSSLCEASEILTQTLELCLKWFREAIPKVSLTAQTEFEEGLTGEVILSKALEEELKVLDLDLWLNC